MNIPSASGFKQPSFVFSMSQPYSSMVTAADRLELRFAGNIPRVISPVTDSETGQTRYLRHFTETFREGHTLGDLIQYTISRPIYQNSTYEVLAASNGSDAQSLALGLFHALGASGSGNIRIEASDLIPDNLSRVRHHFIGGQPHYIFETGELRATPWQALEGMWQVMIGQLDIPPTPLSDYLQSSSVNNSTVKKLRAQDKPTDHPARRGVFENWWTRRMIEEEFFPMRPEVAQTLKRMLHMDKNAVNLVDRVAQQPGKDPDVQTPRIILARNALYLLYPQDIDRLTDALKNLPNDSLFVVGETEGRAGPDGNFDFTGFREKIEEAGYQTLPQNGRIWHKAS